MNRKILPFVLVSAMIMAVLPGCSNGGSSSVSTASKSTAKSTIRVAWWGNQVRNDRTTQVLKAYSKANPNITFETEFSDWSGYWDKMATQAAANSLPDIVQMDYQYLKQYATKNQIADLSSYVGKELDLTDVTDSALSSGKINDKLYAVSLGTTSPAMLYDLEAVKKAGVTIKDNMTITEFIAAAKTIKQKTGETCDFCYSDGESYMEYMVRGQGKVLFEDGKLGIDNSSYALPYFKLYENADDYLTSSDQLEASVGVGIEQGLLVMGKQWMTMTTSNQLSAYATAAKKTLGITTWPVGDNDTQKAMYLKPSMLFCIASTSTNKTECAKVLDYFTNSIDANEVLLTDRGVPISSKVQTAVKAKVDTNSKQLFDYISNIQSNCSTINPPSPDGMTEVATLVHTLTEQVVYKKITAQKAADEFYTQANSILAKAAE